MVFFELLSKERKKTKVAVNTAITSDDFGRRIMGKDVPLFCLKQSSQKSQYS